MTFYQVKDGRIIRELPADRMAVEMTADGVQFVYRERPHPGDVLEAVGHWLHHDPDCAWHRHQPEVSGCDCGLAKAEWRLLHPEPPCTRRTHDEHCADLHWTDDR